MDRRQVYADRLTELGWTDYRLAATVAELRTKRGEKSTTQSIYSSIRKCLNDPANCKQGINDDIVAALNGEQIIRWTNHSDVKL